MYTIENNYKDDDQTWLKCDESDLWIFDKLILARKLGYICGPHGVPVPKKDIYIVRPCVNLMSMGRGAFFTELEGDTDDCIPDGYFWCEVFKGRHLSVDYEDGKQILCVEGLRNKKNPIWKWDKWVRTDDKIEFPNVLKHLFGKYKYTNLEMIDGKIIEIHLRLNTDWVEMNYETTKEMIPVFDKNHNINTSEFNYKYSPCYNRIGFYYR